MSIKGKVLYPIRKALTYSFLPGVMSGLLEKRPKSKFLRGVCPSNQLFNDNKVIVAKRQGYYFELNLSDYMDWILYFHSDTDSSLNILNYVNEGDYVLDIGGNIGQTALFLSGKVGKEGKVISFEPFPKTYQRFEKNLALNKSANNIKLEKIALGDKPAILKMYSENQGNSGQNRISAASDSKGEAFEVVITTLNNYIEANPISKIDLIKIDVEGFEYKALLGASEVIKKYKPGLFIEVNDENLKQQDDSASKLIDMLIGWGYEIFDAENNSKITSYQSGHIDVICRAR